MVLLSSQKSPDFSKDSNVTFNMVLSLVEKSDCFISVPLASDVVH